MSTGDLNGNLQRLLRELKAIKYPADVDEVGLRLGDPVALLPLFNFTLLKFSRHVARFIVRQGFELAGKTDQRFVECCFKLFRDVLNVRTVLTPAQFFEQGYAERKVLLLCDVIAVCKKLHNEEVRQDRLAALKATRQDQVRSRLTAPRRSSPHVKVVRNDDVEIQQVLAPQHLPNASDGAQSVYKTKRTTTTSRSPSPSPGVQPAPAKMVSRPHASRPSSQGRDLELTFRPTASAHIGQVPQRQAPLGPAAAQPPIHTWFMNPAYAASDDANVGLGLGAGLGLGTSGRPDSSAWWRVSPTSPELHFAKAGVAASATTASATANAAADSSTSEVADSGIHLVFGRQPTVASTTGAANQSSLRQASSQQQGLPARDRPPEPVQPSQSQAAAATQRRVGFPSAFLPSATGAGGSDVGAVAGGKNKTNAARDLDEWSFSKFFGPGKSQPWRRAGLGAGDDTDDSSHHDVAGGSDNGSVSELHGDAEAAVGAQDDLDIAGPASDQDRRFMGARSSAHWRTAPQTASGVPIAVGPSPKQQQQVQLASGGVASTAVDSPGSSRRHVRAAMEVEWPEQLAKLERETQQQVQELRNKLASAEEELEKTRSEARQTREALQARVTVLEGRVRFLECEMEMCVRRPPGQDASRAVSPEQASPPSSGGLTAEPSLSWNSPGRTRSAVSAAPRCIWGPAQRRALPLSVGAQQSDGSMLAPAATGAAAAAAPVFSHYQDHIVSDVNPVTFPVSNATSVLAEAEALDPQQAASVEAGGPIGLRRDVHTTAAGTAQSAGSVTTLSLHSTRERVDGQTTLSGPGTTAPGPSQAQALPQYDRGHLPGLLAISQKPLPPGDTSAVCRGPPSFSPMPQPSFSFQPGSLMQQVASAATQLPQQQCQLPVHQAVLSAIDVYSSARSIHPGPGARSQNDSIDSSRTSLRYTTATVSAGGPGHGGLYPDTGTSRIATGQVKSSLDAGTQRLAAHSTEGGAAVAVVPEGQVFAAWRGPERPAVWATGPGSILDRPNMVRDGPGGYGSIAISQAQQAVSAAPTRQQHHTSAPSQNSSLTGFPRAQTQLHHPSASGLEGADGIAGAANDRDPVAPSRTGINLGGGSGMGSGAPANAISSSSSGPRSTDDVISSLYLRYTEAQDFLQTLRKR